ncbi:multicopper oxidase family protein [Brevibacillus agri]|uniref:multicopper oxidase family protein n=1 Tax=Brevibacillus agri TaxID=51101 RepID=UPI002E1CA1BD|nr:multicopper oxidase family protein [Brevibacillus agri]MED1657503.1 multicopper oxidase family protein [Brevibacillus agri]MED1690109.1 multicopper oxidase family protein [Brevibacillus agri]MED1694425.1 multicopper oxidase family protein [Brevibacillus agri]MED1700287.1 multicopper oxidase family protein [Brevibacillus agri]
MRKKILPIVTLFLIGMWGCSPNSTQPSERPNIAAENQMPEMPMQQPNRQGPDNTEILTTLKLRQLPALAETDAIQPTGNVKEYRLEAKPARWELVSGVQTDAYTYNGTVPGPTIRAKEGDTIRVILKNSLPEETSIHWHGLHVPNNMDGVPSFTQHAIKPGETFTYEFLANHAGTYMYHSHFNSVPQIDKGLYGLLVIEPQNNEALKHDREYTMLFGGWNIPTKTGGHQGQTGNDPMAGMSKGKPNGLKQKGNIRSMMDHAAQNKDRQKDPHAGMDMPPTDSSEDDAGSSAMGMDYNYWTINGKSFPDTDPIEVKQGELVHIRLANISNGIHPMHLHGHDFRIIAKDGHPLATPSIVNTVTVNPGETYDIDFIADNPGEWVFHCHELHHTTNADVEPGGLMALVKYIK